MLNGSTKTIDVKNITVPLLNIVGTEDDLVQAASSIPLNDLVSSTDKKLIQFPEGHVELCISSHSHTNLWPKVVAWLQKRPWYNIGFDKNNYSLYSLLKQPAILRKSNGDIASR